MGKKSKAGKRGWQDDLSSSRCSSKPNRTVSLGEASSAVVPPGGAADVHWLKPDVVTLLEDDEGDSMLAATPVLSDDECDAWIRWGESQGFIIEKHAQTASIAHRDNGRLAVESDEIASAIFARLAPWIPAEVGGKRACGCNPNIRLYKYDAGQRFGPHIDQSNRLRDGSVTEFTVLVYLNDAGLEGGETIFYGSHGSAPSDDTLRFRPRRGACLVHAHGLRCLTHEGSAVRKGVKYLLRTDVAFR